jgi:hypothetical protein
VGRRGSNEVCRTHRSKQWLVHTTVLFAALLLVLPLLVVCNRQAEAHSCRVCTSQKLKLCDSVSRWWEVVGARILCTTALEEGKEENDEEKDRCRPLPM